MISVRCVSSWPVNPESNQNLGHLQCPFPSFTSYYIEHLLCNGRYKYLVFCIQWTCQVSFLFVGTIQYFLFWESWPWKHPCDLLQLKIISLRYILVSLYMCNNPLIIFFSQKSWIGKNMAISPLVNFPLWLGQILFHQQLKSNQILFACDLEPEFFFLHFNNNRLWAKQRKVAIPRE